MRKRTLLDVLAALSLATVLLTALGCNKYQARGEVKEGVQAYKSANYEKAIEHFQNAVRLDAHLTVARLYMANVYAQWFVPGVDEPENYRKAQQAIEQYRAVLAAEPGNITSLKGLAYLYLEMKKFDDSRDYLRKVIQADRNDLDAYYSVGVVEWSAAYSDTASRKTRLGLKATDEMRNNTKEQMLCAEIKAANEVRVDEGIKSLRTELEKRRDDDDAMTYLDLLYSLKAGMECGDPEARVRDVKMRDEWWNKAMDTRRCKALQAAQKTSGGILLDPDSRGRLERCRSEGLIVTSAPPVAPAKEDQGVPGLSFRMPPPPPPPPTPPGMPRTVAPATTTVPSVAPPPKVAAPHKLRLSSGVSEGNLIHRVEPVYPQMARIAHVQGDVVLQALIGKDGAVENLRAVSGHPILIQAAMDAVKQWKYKPYLLNGEPVEVETTITVRFHM
jgi:TonB family protein